MQLFNLVFAILPIIVDSNSIPKAPILDSPECSNMKRFCPNLNPNDELAVLECLHSLHPNDLNMMTKKCHQIVWETTNNIIKDDSVVDTLLPLCKNDLARINCRTDGNYFVCLAGAKENIEATDCLDMVKRMENVAFTDYKFLQNFLNNCENDVKQFDCGVIDSQSPSQLATIACLQSNIFKIDDRCKTEILRLSELQADNIKLDKQLYTDCAEDYSRHCSQFAAGSGKVFHCLLRQDPAKLSQKCRSNLLRREKLISQDYKVSKGLMRSCREEIKKTHCRKQTSSDKTVRLAQILLCLENVSKNGTKLSSDCELELFEHRRMLMEDFRLSPEIVDKCKRETLRFCKGNETGGKTIHCLMKYAKEERGQFDRGCQNAIADLLKESDAGENWKVDPVLHKACSSVVETLCKNVYSGESRVMNCLIDNIGSEGMSEACEDALIQIQYFVARRFELDDQLYRTCKKDAVNICNVAKDWENDVGSETVLPCLYRYINSDQKDYQLNGACMQNIRRVMRQRAISVDLEPAIEESCLDDLGSLCHDQTEKGAEMKCLQKNYNELEKKCQETIGMFIEFQSEHAELNPYISKFCPKIIEHFCKEEVKSDEGDVMECLIAHKNDPVVKGNVPCRASIEHFQMISLNDYRFSYKFKMACKPYAMRFCSSSRTKNDVVRCLSEKVLNATVKGVKSQIPKECKQQLKSQLFQQRENIMFDPVLKAACAQDIDKYCPNVLKGNAQVLECLQSQINQLTPKCEKEVFKVKKEEIFDNTLDYALITMCADAIDQFCAHSEKDTVFECLKENRDEKGFNKKCRSIVMHRIVEQNSNYQLNPSLQQNCDMDMNKFCKNFLENRDKQTNGLVIKCLKNQFKLSRLSSKCEKEMVSILKEQALNVNLNPLIRTVCKDELATICKNDDSDDSGDTEECLKNALLTSRIPTPACKVEVANMIEESQADIHVDPILQEACALDLLNFCSDVPQGNGRHISCLRMILDSDKKLSPKCKNMLKKRLEMYKNAALFSPEGPPEDLQQLYNEVVTSPSKQYFFLIILTFFGTVFIGGIICGRMNMRRYMLLKSK